MTLHERIQLLVTGFFVLLALAAVYSTVTVGQRDQVLADAERMGQANEEVNRLLTSYVDQETGVRGYVISQDEAFLVPYHQGRTAADTALRTLRDLFADSPEFLAIIDQVDHAARLWHTRAAEMEVTATAEGRTDAAASLVASGEGQERFDALRDEIQRLRNTIRSARIDADAQLAVWRRVLNLTLGATFAAGAVLLLLTSLAMDRWSTRPLAQITEAVRQVAGGQLDRRIGVVGPRDIAELAEDAELMRRQIVAELDSARRAEQALRSQGAIVTALREELRPTGHDLPPTLSMDAAFEPVKGVLAGDWYDVLRLSDDTVALCLIDVSGHGQATGLFALQAKNLLLAALRQRLDPGTALGWLADALGDTGDVFLTCFVGLVSPDTGTLRYASAGHLPTLITRDGRVDQLDPTGPLLGPLPGRWESVQTQLAPASLVVVYTDGVTEARGLGGEEFGEERLRAVVAARAGEHPSALVSTCLDLVHDFARGEPDDDLTIVALRWLPRD